MGKIEGKLLFKGSLPIETTQFYAFLEKNTRCALKMYAILCVFLKELLVVSQTTFDNVKIEGKLLFKDFFHSDYAILCVT